jgi:hypothetical protein
MPLPSPSPRSGSSSGATAAMLRHTGVISSDAPVVDQSRSGPRFTPEGSRYELTAAAVLVVFADHAGCPWLRPLRRGFRHCFVVMRAGSVWLACEPLKDRIELDALAAPDNFDLAAFYCQQGHRVLLGRRVPARPRRRFALAPLTCVTVVKRVLGIAAPWVWTPWQLYAHLSGLEDGFRPCQAKFEPAVAPTCAGISPLDREVI